MSTVTVAKKNGQIAIAADTQSLWGSSKDSATYVVNHQKILKVGDSFIGICGPTSFKVVLADYFASLNSAVHLEGVQEIFRTWNRLHKALKEQYFLNADEEDEDNSVETSRMDVLIANPHGIFGVSAYRGVQEFRKLYAHGYGREYALGAMYAGFEDESKTAEALARLAVQAASEFDEATGLPVISFSVAQVPAGSDSLPGAST